METLVVEEEESSSSMEEETVDGSAANISLPIEIIEQILARLPVKSILRFKSVSKPWLSCISDPSFPELHLTSTHRAALFFSTHDTISDKRHLFSAARDGGPLTHLLTLSHSYPVHIAEAEHLNGGLVGNSSLTMFSVHLQAFVVNPSTRKIFKLPDPAFNKPTSAFMNICCLFGFDESRNEHKVMLIRKVHVSAKIETMIFSLSDRSWRKIDGEPPIGFFKGLQFFVIGCVCVNSIIHLMVENYPFCSRKEFGILAFDLTTEEFSVISVLQGVLPHQARTRYSRNGKDFTKNNTPLIMKINGRVGIFCHDRVTESNGVHLWMLQDYDNCVWARETIEFPDSWNEFGGSFPLPVDVHMDEIIFASPEVSGNVIRLHVYNMKTRCFKSLEFTLDDQFLCSETMIFDNIKGYVESIMPL